MNYIQMPMVKFVVVVVEYVVVVVYLLDKVGGRHFPFKEARMNLVKNAVC